MKFFLLALAISILSFPAFASDKTALCVLQNAELCGKWQGKDFGLIISGDKLKWDNGEHADCIVLKEKRYETRAYSLLRCKNVFIKPEKMESGHYRFSEHIGEYFPLLVLRPRNYKTYGDKKYMRIFSIWNLECSVDGYPYPNKKKCDLQELEQGGFDSEPYYGD